MAFIKKWMFAFVCTFVIVVGYIENAHAYIDPASGSYLLQFLLAGLLGGLFALKMYWKKLKLKLSSYFSKKDNSVSEQDQ